MHELSIALSLIEVAAEEAQRRGAARVGALHLKLGPLSGVVRAALESAFELAREGSPLPDAELVIEPVPLVAYCSACAAQQPLASPADLRCPICGEPTPEIVTGRELELTAMEIAA